MKMSNSHELTPEQAGDVINYFHSGETQNALNNGWKEKLPLGASALHASSFLHSILPDGTPLLTRVEMNAGLEFISITHPRTT